MTQQAILNGTGLTLGTCYYPEHWPESMWKEDLLRMLDTGIEVIRIAEREAAVTRILSLL